MLEPSLVRAASTVQEAVTDRLIAIAPDSDLAVLSTQQNHWLQLQAQGSPLQQITAALKAQRDQGQPIHELHLIAHGNSSGLQIAGRTINTVDLSRHVADLANWNVKTLVLWSCQLAQNKDFIARLEELTGAEIFASNDSINCHQLTTWNNQGRHRSLDELIDHKTLSNWRGSLSSSFFTQLGNDIDGESAGDYSGTSVSISDDGTIVAIGGRFNDGGGTTSGHTRIYQYSSGSWSQLGSDIDGEAAEDRSGYSVSLSSDGKTVAIGAYLNDGNGSDSGHTRIYQYSSNSWSQLGGDIDGEAEGDYSGTSVSLSDDGKTVAIGAPNNDGYGSSSGHARIYQYSSSSGSWSQLGGDIDGEAAGDGSGISVSLSDDGKIVAIGGYGNDGNGFTSGHARIYQYSSSSDSWSQLGGDIDGEAAGDSSGFSISLSEDGSIVAVGATGNDANGTYSGHTRIYQYSASSDSWNKLGGDIDGEAAGDLSGFKVSLSSDGKTVAIGAHYNDGNGSDSGHTRIYQYSSGNWTQLGSDINGETAGDLSGASVSLSSDGRTVAIGATQNDDNGSSSGHVRIFSLPSSSSSSSGGGESGNGRTSESIENTIINGRRFWTHNVEVLREQSDINYGLLNNNDFLEVVGGINNFANGNNGDDHIILRGGKGRYLGGADNDRIEVFNTAIGSWVNGNFGADLITGSAGGVTYRGGPGNDIFAVSAGDIWGDKDADTFQATAGAEFATIHDYTVGLDRIKGVEGGSFSLTNQGVLYSLGDDQMLLLKGITDVSQVTVI